MQDQQIGQEHLPASDANAALYPSGAKASPEIGAIELASRPFYRDEYRTIFVVEQPNGAINVYFWFGYRLYTQYSGVPDKQYQMNEAIFDRVSTLTAVHAIFIDHKGLIEVTINPHFTQTAGEVIGEILLLTNQLFYCNNADPSISFRLNGAGKKPT